MPAPRFLFQLGTTPDLSAAELRAVLAAEERATQLDLMNGFIQVELADVDRARQIFQKLGGSVKVLKFLRSIPLDQAKNPQASVLAELEANASLPFAIAEHGRDHLPKLDVFQLKKELKARGVSSRFLNGPRSGLSAAILSHHKVFELNVIQTRQEVLFASTVAVQDIDDWTTRDRGKVYADRKKGMLPPKVARMMVNLGMGAWQEFTKSDQKPLLYDPFCGSGTVLLEGWAAGADVIGSDLDPASIKGAQENLTWFGQTYHLEGAPKVFEKDVTRVEMKDFPHPVDVIVTEPFLGKQTPRPEVVGNVLRGLEKLYWGAFRTWQHVLAPDAIVVMIWPEIVLGDRHYGLDGLIDKLASLGYTPLSEPIRYARPNAVVNRQIWQFRFQKVTEK